MIARLWRGRASRESADAYVRHFTESVAPGLDRLAGHRGAYLLKRETAGRIEFLAVSLWDSLAAIRGFAGTYPERAVVEPEARAVLSEADLFARHYEIVFRSGETG